MELLHLLSFIIIASLVSANFYYKSEVTYSNNTLLHFQHFESHAIYVEESTNNTVFYYDRLSPSNSYSKVLGGQILQIKSHRNNSLTNNYFLIQLKINSNQKELRLYRDNFTLYDTLKVATNSDSFGRISNLQTPQQYCYQFYNHSENKYFIFSSQTSANLSFQSPLISMKYGTGSKLFLLHQNDDVTIHQLDFTQLLTISFSSSDDIKIKLSTDGSLIFFIYGDKVKIFNTNTGIQDSEWSLSDRPIKDVNICHGNIFLFYRYQGNKRRIRGYNLQTNILEDKINLIRNQEGDIMCQTFPNFSIITSEGKIHQFAMDGTVQAPQNNSATEVNTTNQTNQTNSTNSTNITNQNNTVDSNLTGELNQTNLTTIQNEQKQSFQNQQQEIESFYKSFFQSTETAEGINTTGNFLSAASSLSVLNTLLDPLYAMFEDFWFYKYHAEIYPYFVQHFTQEMDLLNLLKIKPQFLNNFPTIDVLKQNSINYNNKTIIHERAPTNKYFISAIKDIYTFNFALALFGFLTLKIIYKCLQRWKHQQSLKGSFYRFFKRHTMWWNLIIALIDNNIIFTTFSGFVQLLNPGCYDIEDKVNLTVTVLYLFINMIFPFVLYPFIFTYVEKSEGEIILSCANFTRKGIFMELTFVSIRSFVRGAIHAFFLQYYSIQISCLVGSNFVLICICLLLRKHFINQWMFAIYLLYYISFLTFDFLLLSRKAEMFSFIARDQYEEILPYVVFIILGSTIFKILMLIFLELKELVEYCKSKNRIFYDQEHEKKLKKKKKSKKKKQRQQNKQKKQKSTQIDENRQGRQSKRESNKFNFFSKFFLQSEQKEDEKKAKKKFKIVSHKNQIRPQDIESSQIDETQQKQISLFTDKKIPKQKQFRPNKS